MKWIKRKLQKWILEEGYNENTTGKNAVMCVGDANRVDSNPVLNFRIFSAQNGIILEFNSYNEKTDRRSSSTYIINHGEDVADYVRQSLPMEMMKV